MKQIQTAILGLAIGILLIVYILCTQLATEQARMAGEEWRETCEPRAIEIIGTESPREAACAHESAVTVTAYCPCEKCCGEYANGYTATGAKATQGVTIATDPDVIPLGTEVEIDGHIYIAQDVFLEQYPETLVLDGGTLSACPVLFSSEYRNAYGGCASPYGSCAECRREFWMQEVE